MAQTVIGFFDDASEAQKAVERLQSSGISRDRIDVSRGSSTSTSTNRTDVDYRNTSDTDRVTRDGDTVDRDGRNTNAITDFFNSLFGGKDDDDSAERYSRVASSSNTIVTVHAQTSEEAENAADILDDAGAIDVDERAAQYGYGSSRGTETTSDRIGVSNDRDTTIERMEENLNVSKRTEESGGVRVRSRIVEKPVEEHIRLREEHVNVERTPVDRPVSGDELNRFQDQDIEMRERTEVPVVNKEARVVEEIKISKDVDERDETIRENVRHTEIDIDETDRNNINRNNTTGRDTRLDSDDDSSRGIL
jgi:stress response protein YsnF